MYNAHGNFRFVKYLGDGNYMRQGRETTRVVLVKYPKPVKKDLVNDQFSLRSM